ncbi:ABC transporter ATP-binding protein [Paenibacillus camerounensis]|uniref:ABC transporter ATP-binding protein n=1 Tax=Paenibacillus camerounensis TaxID=1243663 RepID=UPI0005AB05E2|nr:ABC transporter ATP-binding protein [Paenibacillus camerounensis]
MTAKTIRSVWEVTETKKRKLVILILLNLIINLLFIVYLNSIKDLINSVTTREFGALGKLAALLFLVVLINILLNRISKFYTNRLQMQTEIKMSNKFYEKLNRVYLGDLESFSQADVITRFNDDLKSIVNFQFNTLLSYISNITRLALILLYIGINNVYLLAFVVLMPVLIIIPRHFGKKSGEAYIKAQESKTALNMISKDIIDHADDIRIYSANEYFMDKYRSSERKLVTLEKKKTLYDNIVWIAGVGGYQAIYISLYVIGGILAYNNRIDFGVIVSTFIVIDPMVDILMQLPGIMPAIYNVRKNIERYNEIMNLPEMPAGNVSGEASNTNSIILNQVSYTYKYGRKALDNISLEIKDQERIAVIGKSGSGKSTLLKQLMGYDGKYNGSLMLNGQELKAMGTDDIKKYISYLPQEIFLQHDTIENNIKGVLYNCKLENFIRYARIAEIHSEIENMSSGYQTVIQNDGENMSVGQRQRLGIAMAVAKQKPFLLLDECFSGVDALTEQKILDHMFSELSCGVVLVTHRISADIMSKFDRILLMDNGQIAAYENYNVMLQNSLYKSMLKENA